LRAMLELGDGVGVLVAEGVDRLGVAADVSAEADAVALLVAIAGAEVGDQEADFDAVAEGEPMEMEFDRGGVEGEVLVDGHRFDCSNASGGVKEMGNEKWEVASSDERAGVCHPGSLRGGARLGVRDWSSLRMTGAAASYSESPVASLVLLCSAPTVRAELRGVELHRALGHHPLDALLVGQHRPVGEALEGAVHEHFQGYLGVADPAHAVGQARRAKAVLAEQVALAATAEHLVVSDVEVA